MSADDHNCKSAPTEGERGLGPAGDESEAEATRRALMAGLQRWWLDVSEWRDLSAGQWDMLLALLPDAESARVRRFWRENDRRLALGSRLLQRAIVSKVFSLKFSDVDIRRTPERKPFFAGKHDLLLHGSTSPLLNNWNFNVSHHGNYVAIASEPVCLCGVDLVDTNRQSNERGPAEDYFRYFTAHFTDSEWEMIKRGADDESKLRRFYLTWGLKEAYVKAVGQGLGYDLRRISFPAGDWLNCCSSEDGNTKGQRPPCNCARAVGSIAPYGGSVGSDACRGDDGKASGVEEEKAGDGGDWETEDGTGCLCGVGVATVEVDGVPRRDWSFQVFPLPSGYAACLARGPPSACSPSGQAAGVISEPNAGEEELARGQSLPQVWFRAVKLEDILPKEVVAKFLELGKEG